MAQDELKPEDTETRLRYMVNLCRWLITGGIAVGALDLLSRFSVQNHNASIFLIGDRSRLHHLWTFYDDKNRGRFLSEAVKNEQF